jgi:hypothetical protein
MTRKAIKGSVITDHLADNVIEESEPLNFDFLYKDVQAIENEKGDDWWIMYFDGAVNMYGNGAEAVIIFPDDRQYPISIKLQFDCTNNIAKYEACTHSLEAPTKMKIKKLNVYRDSMLIIYLVKGE